MFLSHLSSFGDNTKLISRKSLKCITLNYLCQRGETDFIPQFANTEKRVDLNPRFVTTVCKMIRKGKFRERARFFLVN